MVPALAVLAAWLLFSGTHLLLATDPLRARLVARLGERGFVQAFSLVAAVAFSVLAATGAAFHAEGVAGPGLGAHPVVRPLAQAAIVLGFGLAAGSLAAYPRSPTALFAGPIQAPRGAERISRHGFFYGLALWASAHVLLASTLAGALFFAGFAVQSVVGSMLQDRKLAARRGPDYREYLSQTSGLPFAAMLMGRQRLAPSEQPWLAYGAGVGLALLLRQAHAHLFDYHGLYLIVSMLGGAAFAGFGAERRARRLRKGASLG